jgi:hypothetical protein
MVGERSSSSQAIERRGSWSSSSAWRGAAGLASPSTPHVTRRSLSQNLPIRSGYWVWLKQRSKRWGRRLLEPAIRTGGTLLHMAAGHGHRRSCGAPNRARYRYHKDGRTSLHMAASNGHAEVVALLIERGADVKVGGARFVSG